MTAQRGAHSHLDWRRLRTTPPGPRSPGLAAPLQRRTDASTRHSGHRGPPQDIFILLVLHCVSLTASVGRTSLCFVLDVVRGVRSLLDLGEGVGASAGASFDTALTDRCVRLVPARWIRTAPARRD